MFSVALSSVLVMGAAFAAAQSTTEPALPPGMSTYPDVPHASKTFAFEDLPYRIDDSTHLIRGNQHGYNICNDTTAGQDSLCQTSHFNSIDDFCLWAPPDFGRTIGDIEGIMVAWCTKPGHGTRLIPEGAITGLQWITTPDYVQAVGFIDQTLINVLADDSGGEMDPHGADLRGNPMGGIVYSNAWTGAPTQVIEWHLFLGSGRFCYKACDPRGRFDDRYCEHILDRIGCDYNVPNRAQDGVFEQCLGDNQDFPGVYTTNGVVMTYTQPAGDLGDIGFSPMTPSSSSCTQFESAALFSGLPTGVSPGSSTTSEDARPTGSGGVSSRRSTGTPSPSQTAGGAQNSQGSSASKTAALSGAALVGAVLSAVFLA
ncbi:hypothetical protein FA15DRAFT_129123 [Coprinopsis marcescibilis]|uniref:Macrofage activating glycoprotein n=1 Tax=Coprinopsis marcescibilis TaxID=230819 RepID=A0A5C3KJV3_COPMA|nr:hypothetical protein FA15DRAFT_129123 [Coprinopsis marcescibilis]